VLPVRRIVAAEKSDVEPMLRSIDRFDWIVFSSVHAVDGFSSSLESLGIEVPSRVQIAAIGPSTRGALENKGFRVAACPQQANASGLLAEAPFSLDLRGLRIFLPRSDVARLDLEEGLRGKGADVEAAIVYRNLPVSELEADRVLLMKKTQLDLVLLASPSAAEALTDLARKYGFLDQISRARAVAIGPTTFARARELELEVAAQALQPTEEAVLEALRRALEPA
jgi:uroporphyrinogen-III synthase